MLISLENTHFITAPVALNITVANPQCYYELTGAVTFDIHGGTPSYNITVIFPNGTIQVCCISIKGLANLLEILLFTFNVERRSRYYSGLANSLQQ